MKLNRRQFLKSTLAASALVGMGGMGTLLTPRSAHAAASSPQLQKWAWPIRGLNAGLPGPLLGDPNGIPVLTGASDPTFGSPTTYYQITVAEFTDQLHPSLPATRLWGYRQTGTPLAHQRHLGGVIITPRGQAARIRFTNTLPATHIIPVDITVPGANQAHNRTATHIHGGLVPWISDGGPFDWFDPWADPTTDPTNASNHFGQSFLNGKGSVLDNIIDQPMMAGQADYFYPNNQSERLVWYHDHAHGITRLNAYAGIASGYLILDAIGEGYRGSGKIPAITSTAPIVFQDKVFVNPLTIGVTDPTWATFAAPRVQSLGSLWYEHVYNPKEFRLLKSKKNLPVPNPSAIPEFFGDTMLCNGTVYPKFTVEAKRYRFVILNACNARFLNINLLDAGPTPALPTTPVEVATNPKTGFANLATNPAGPPIIQIGAEGGFLLNEVAYPNGLPFNPATLTGNLLLGCAERADVIIDFTGKAGREFIMYNDAPGPFPAGPPTTDYYLGNPKNPIQPIAGTGPDTRNILRFSVDVAKTPDPQLYGPVNDVLGTPVVYQGARLGNILNPGSIDPPLLGTAPAALGGPWTAPAGTPLRPLTLNEDFDQYGRLRQLLGTTTPGVLPGFGREYLEPVTEKVANNATEVWDVYNLTADTHPIHFHLVNVQILSRQPFKVVNGVFTRTGKARGPEPNEIGWKETVQMHPGEVTSVIMKFELPPVPFDVPFSTRVQEQVGAALQVIPQANEFVWHCHILEHEEHDMMRPLVVTGANPMLT